MGQERVLRTSIPRVTGVQINPTRVGRGGRYTRDLRIATTSGVVVLLHLEGQSGQDLSLSFRTTKRVDDDDGIPGYRDYSNKELARELTERTDEDVRVVEDEQQAA